MLIRTIDVLFKLTCRKLSCLIIDTVLKALDCRYGVIDTLNRFDVLLDTSRFEFCSDAVILLVLSFTEML